MMGERGNPVSVSSTTGSEFPLARIPSAQITVYVGVYIDTSCTCDKVWRSTDRFVSLGGTLAATDTMAHALWQGPLPWICSEEIGDEE